MSGDQRHQTVVVRADRFGAGTAYPIAKPRAFKFSVALPHDWTRHLSWHQYFLYLSEKDRKNIQNYLDEIEKKLKKGGWEQIGAQEYRRRVK